jgi:heterotetrameric sarcosine oxidase gamma subunit
MSTSKSYHPYFSTRKEHVFVIKEAFIPRSPFMALKGVSGGARGVVVTDRDRLGLATVMARRGQVELLARRIRETYSIELPRTNCRKEAHRIAFAGIGPETWLATCEQGNNEFAASLHAQIGTLASISDQTDGYAVLRLSGPQVRNALSKLIPVDVHPRAFRSGDAASTVAAHIGVTIWRLDSDDDAPIFEIAVFRSLAASFWHALAESAAEFGFIVTN